MNYLITGGAGFIGSHVVEHLLKRGARVTVIDNFDPFYPRELKEQNLALASQYQCFRLVEADIRDYAAVRAQVDDSYDCIVHLAAKAGVRPSIQDPMAYQTVNVAGTQNLLELARELSIPQFVFASSSSVYGVNPNVPWSEDDHALLPISPYASTKVSGELLGHVYSHLFNTRFIALRLFTVFGPRQRPDLAIRKFMGMIASDRPVPLFGDGSTSRDYTYIDDVVTGICAATSYRETMYEIINLGNNRIVSLLEMVRGIEQAVDRKAVLDWQHEQAGDVPRTWGDIRKAERLLGYRPTVPFAEGLARLAAWMREQVAVGVP
jgi:UDP-glucuronate 4-epimerase